MISGLLGLRVVPEMDCGWVGGNLGAGGIVLNMFCGDGGLKLSIH